MRQEWFAAKDVASIMGLSKRSIELKAKKQSWQSRPRTGRGGGKEYHFSSLPEVVQVELALSEAKAGVAACQAEVISDQEAVPGPESAAVLVPDVVSANNGPIYNSIEAAAGTI